MINTDYFKNKKVTVVGLGRSGYAAGLLLKDLGSEVSITDKADGPSLRENLTRLKAKGIDNIELGRHTKDFIRERDLVIVSPGVDDNSEAPSWADELRIPVISEIELAFCVCPATVIATTGTNGKTTVTTLIGKVLEAAGLRVHVCGNIGNSFSGEVAKMKQGDFVSLEVSSFQLERIKRFKPRISVILNFSCDHLDRYKDMNEYLAAKKRIFMNQDHLDFLVLNYDDPVVRDLSKQTQAEVIYFQNESDVNLNQAAVIAVGSRLGVSRDSCLKVFRNFKGVSHRMELIDNIEEIEFVNDSKATNVHSAIWALNNIHKPVLLIAGGRDKGSDYSIISDLIKKKVKEVILIGEAREKIGEIFRNLLPLSNASTLEEAVAVAYRKATAGDCVLLSPMCASFDMFQNYEHRGEVFRKAVLELKNKGDGSLGNKGMATPPQQYGEDMLEGEELPQ